MTKKIYYYDLVERVIWTFLQGWAAAWVLLEGADIDTLFSSTNLKVGLGAGVIAIAKGILAKTIGDPDSAATLTSPPDHA